MTRMADSFRRTWDRAIGTYHRGVSRTIFFLAIIKRRRSESTRAKTGRGTRESAPIGPCRLIDVGGDPRSLICRDQYDWRIKDGIFRQGATTPVTACDTYVQRDNVVQILVWHEIQWQRTRGSELWTRGPGGTSKSQTSP